MKRAVGYFRVSTDKAEQKESIKNQEDLFLNYIRDNNFILHRFYIDEGITGTGSKMRPAFEEMIADMKRGMFDVIVVKELSRLARNMELASSTMRLASEHDIQIVSIDGRIDTFDEKKNHDYGLYAWLYQRESQQTSDRIKSVYQAKQKKGQYLGSIPPYGYLVKDKKLFKRNDFTEDVIKEIFRLYLQGWGQEKIARHLDKQGYPTPAQLAEKSNAGRFWLDSSVKKILMNYHYMGHLVQHRETSRDISIVKRRQVPENEMIWVKNTHEAIIDETTFYLVQEKLESKKRAKPGNSKGKTSRYSENRHLFVNFLFCAECGSPYWWRKNTHGYLCGSRLKRGRSICDNEIIREKQLINIILNDVKNFLDEDIKIDIEGKLKKEQAKIEKKMYSLANQIKNIEQRNKNCLDLLVDGTITKDDYRIYIDQNNNEITSIQNEIDSFSASQKKERLDINSIKSQLKEVLELKTLNRELLNILVNRIEVSKSGELKVFYTFTQPQVYNFKKRKSID